MVYFSKKTKAIPHHTSPCPTNPYSSHYRKPVTTVLVMKVEMAQGCEYKTHRNLISFPHPSLHPGQPKPVKQPRIDGKCSCFAAPHGYFPQVSGIGQTPQEKLNIFSDSLEYFVCASAGLINHERTRGASVRQSDTDTDQGMSLLAVRWRPLLNIFSLFFLVISKKKIYIPASTSQVLVRTQDMQVCEQL